jgi:hypothetical protein
LSLPLEIQEKMDEILQTKHPDLYRRWRAVADKLFELSPYLRPDTRIDHHRPWEAWGRALQNGWTGELERHEADYVAALEKFTDECDQSEALIKDDRTYQERLKSRAEFRGAMGLLEKASDSGDPAAIEKCKADVLAAWEKRHNQNVIRPSLDRKPGSILSKEPSQQEIAKLDELREVRWPNPICWVYPITTPISDNPIERARERVRLQALIVNCDFPIAYREQTAHAITEWNRRIQSGGPMVEGFKEFWEQETGRKWPRSKAPEK